MTHVHVRSTGLARGSLVPVVMVCEGTCMHRDQYGALACNSYEIERHGEIVE